MNKFLLFLASLNILFADPFFEPLPIKSIENKDKYVLGKRLFFDPNLSRDKTVACVNCHILQVGGADSNKVSYGVSGQKGKKNSPSVFNTKYNIAQDWIGQYDTIKARSKMAFITKEEMDGDIPKTIAYIRKNPNLNPLFIKIYQKVDEEAIFDAITYYVENLTTPNSLFDKYLRGEAKLSQKQKEGLELFKSYGCVSCHNGINIGGNMYQKIGIFKYEDLLKDLKDEDTLGRFRVTKNKDDIMVFKVPSLRNVTKTAPYFHSGSVKNIEIVIKEMGEHQLGIDIPKKDIIKIKEFLYTLEGEFEDEF